MLRSRSNNRRRSSFSSLANLYGQGRHSTAGQGGSCRHSVSSFSIGSKQASGIEQKISHLQRFLSVLPERAREPHVAAAAFCGNQCRPGAANRRHRDSEMVVGRGGAGARVRVRVGGPFFLRAQQTRDISPSRLQLDGRLAVVVGYFDRQTKVLNLCPGNAIRGV